MLEDTDKQDTGKQATASEEAFKDNCSFYGFPSEDGTCSNGIPQGHLDDIFPEFPSLDEVDNSIVLVVTVIRQLTNALGNPRALYFTLTYFKEKDVTPEDFVTFCSYPVQFKSKDKMIKALTAYGFTLSPTVVEPTMRTPSNKIMVGEGFKHIGVATLNLTEHPAHYDKVSPTEVSSYNIPGTLDIAATLNSGEAVFTEFPETSKTSENTNDNP